MKNQQNGKSTQIGRHLYMLYIQITSMHTKMHLLVCMQVCICICRQSDMGISVCMYIHRYTYYTYTHVVMDEYMYVHMYVCMYICCMDVSIFRCISPDTQQYVCIF